jgi:hypothetical protein
MDGVALLRRAEEAGLRVEAVGDKLVVRGPRQAEPMVRLLAEHKGAVLAALAPASIELRRWQERYVARSLAWAACRARLWHEAQRLAWGELQCDWHMQHGTRLPAWQCAGCLRPIGGLAAIDMPDGNRVHLEPLDCAVAFGKRWREAADAALAELGLGEPRATA